MFAVVRTGGKQYRVAPGDKIVVEKMDGEAGDKINLGDVLLAGDGGKLQSVDGLKVAAEIVAQAKADKVTVFKKRRRHNYRRKKGHRQQHTILRIVSIGDHKAEAKPKAAKEQAPAAAKAPVKAEAEAKSAKPAAPQAAPAKSAAKAAPAAKKPDAPKAAKPKAEKPKADKAKPTKKPAAAKAAAKPASTKNAAPAKGAAKKPAKK